MGGIYNSHRGRGFLDGGVGGLKAGQNASCFPPCSRGHAPLQRHGKERWVWDPGSSRQSPSWRDRIAQEARGGWSVCANRKEALAGKWRGSSRFLFPAVSFRPYPSPRNGVTCTRGGSFLLIKPPQKLPQRLSQSPLARVTANAAKLAKKTGIPGRRRDSFIVLLTSF